MRGTVRMISGLAAALLVGGVSAPLAAQAAPGDPTVAVGGVSCVDGDGSLAVTLEAAPEDTRFYLTYAEPDFGEYVDEVVDVDAGATKQHQLTGLPDGDLVIMIGAESENHALDVADHPVTVACDVAPEGPYTNAKAHIGYSCGDGLPVRALNKPVGGNTEDLQPVAFVVTIALDDPDAPVTDDDPTDDPTEDPTDEPTDGPTDEPTDDPTDVIEESPRVAADPVVTTLDTFTLDATTPSYTRDFTDAEVGGSGVVTVTADGKVVAQEQYYGGCVAVPSASGGGENALPNTGLDARQAWLAGLALLLIGVGSRLVRRSRLG